MNITVRTAALEKRVGPSGPPHTCPGCRPESRSGRSVFVFDEGQDFDACKICGNPIDEQGRRPGLRIGGRVLLQTVVLHDGPAPHRDEEAC